MITKNLGGLQKLNLRGCLLRDEERDFRLDRITGMTLESE